MSESKIRKGDVVHYVQDAGSATGHHLKADVLKVVSQSPLTANLLAFFEIGGQNPVSDHMHLVQVAKTYDPENQDPGTWHQRDECVNNE